MLQGRFGNTSGRPYIEGRIYLPRLNVRSNISFLVDTGADRSLLMPLDGTRMGLDYNQLAGNQEAVGIGGVSRHFVEPALVVFSEAGKYLYIYSINLTISSSNTSLMDVPSLLGRDILDQWKMTYNPTKKELTFVVNRADFTFPIPKK